MKKNDFHDLILKSLDDLKVDVKELRETDVPNLRLEIALVKERSSRAAKITTAVGGLIAVAVSSAIAYFSK